MNSFIHVGGLDIEYDDKDEEPSCIEQLKDWIQTKKLEYREACILKAKNSVENNKKYDEVYKKSYKVNMESKKKLKKKRAALGK